jgi:hypothetical protein
LGACPTIFKDIRRLKARSKRFAPTSSSRFCSLGFRWFHNYHTSRYDKVGLASAGPDDPGDAVTPNGAYVYVSVGYRNISVVSTATDTVLATISTTGNTRGSNLAGIAVTSNGAFGYAAVADFGEVAVFDTNSNAVVATVPVGSFPGVVIMAAGGVSTTPTLGSTLTGSVTFNWTASAGVSAYWLDVGSTLGGNQIYQSGDLGTC